MKEDNPDWLGLDKQHEVLSPGRGGGKVRRVDKIEAGEEKKRVGRKPGPKWTKESKGVKDEWNGPSEEEKVE